MNLLDNPDILSLCAGGGGIDEGLKQTGFKTKLAIDRDPKNLKYSQDCKKTFELNHPDTEFIVGDILEHEDSLGRFDVVIGGVPCPEFSSANVNRSFDDTLVKCFWRIVEKTKAKYWLMENVPDVIHVCKLRNHLINCADYGTPQIRKRRLYTNLIKPAFTHAEEAYVDLLGVPVKKWISVEECLGLKGILQDRKTTFNDGWRNRETERPSFTMLSDSRAWLVSKTGFDGCNQIEKTRPSSEPAPTITASDTLQLTNYKIYSVKYLQEKNPAIFKKHKLNELNKPAVTVCAKDRGFQGDGLISDGEYARKLTNDEVKIIQGFPKDYKFGGGKTSVKKQIGNAMPPQPIKAFFEQLIKNY